MIKHTAYSFEPQFKGNNMFYIVEDDIFQLQMFLQFPPQPNQIYFIIPCDRNYCSSF